MNTFKVKVQGPTLIEGHAEHESNDFNQVGEDVLRRGLVVDGVWYHPSQIKSIELVPVEVSAPDADPEPEPTAKTSKKSAQE